LEALLGSFCARLGAAATMTNAADSNAIVDRRCDRVFIGFSIVGREVEMGRPVVDARTDKVQIVSD
jgi:hypothetical protein